MDLFALMLAFLPDIYVRAGDLSFSACVCSVELCSAIVCNYYFDYDEVSCLFAP